MMSDIVYPKTAHILITDRCNRTCKFCCNKQYDLNTLSPVTYSELWETEMICLTGGEPFLYGQPLKIAKYIKKHYRGTTPIIVYTNAYELYLYLLRKQHKPKKWKYINGLTISIKNEQDRSAFECMAKDFSETINLLEYNKVYVFGDYLMPKKYIYNYFGEKIIPINREWEPDFKPAGNSIFRKWDQSCL